MDHERALSTYKVSRGSPGLQLYPRWPSKLFLTVSEFSRIIITGHQRALSTSKVSRVLQDHSFTHAGHQRKSFEHSKVSRGSPGSQLYPRWPPKSFEHSRVSRGSPGSVFSGWHGWQSCKSSECVFALSYCVSVSVRSREHKSKVVVTRSRSGLLDRLLDPASLDFAPKYGRLQILERIVDLSDKISERFDLFVAHSFLLAPRYSC